MAESPKPPRSIEQRRRKDQRYPHVAGLRARCSSWENFHKLFSANVSSAGLFIPTDREAKIGDSVEVELVAPDDTSIRLVGAVAHILPGSTGQAGLGIRVQDVAEEDAARYRALVAEATKRHQIETSRAGAFGSSTELDQPEIDETDRDEAAAEFGAVTQAGESSDAIPPGFLDDLFGSTYEGTNPLRSEAGVAEEPSAPAFVLEENEPSAPFQPHYAPPVIQEPAFAESDEDDDALVDPSRTADSLPALTLAQLEDPKSATTTSDSLTSDQILRRDVFQEDSPFGTVDTDAKAAEPEGPPGIELPPLDLPSSSATQAKEDGPALTIDATPPPQRDAQVEKEPVRPTPRIPKATARHLEALTGGDLAGGTRSDLGETGPQPTQSDPPPPRLIARRAPPAPRVRASQPAAPQSRAPQPVPTRRPPPSPSKSETPVTPAYTRPPAPAPGAKAPPPAPSPTRPPPPPPPQATPPAAPGSGARRVPRAKSHVAMDFGTSRSSVSVVQDRKVSVIRLTNGGWDIASVVGFLPNGAVVLDQQARQLLGTDPQNAIHSPKRLLGRRYDDRDLQSYIGSLAMQHSRAPDGGVRLHARNKSYTIEQACAPIIYQLKLAAQHQLREEVTAAVFTAPVSFDDARYRALERSAQLAGLKVLEFVDEPTAAALPHRYHPSFKGLVAVYDFGGGTFDFSVVEATAADVQVVATAGDVWLGGDDFDEALAGAAANAFWREHNVELRNQVVQWQRLLFAAERAKRELSYNERAVISVPEVALTSRGKLNLQFAVTRPQFAQICAGIIERSLDTCREALELSDIKISEINAVYLSGGTSYIPAVREALARTFGKAPMAAVPPERAVVTGAAVYAALLDMGSLSG